MDEAIDLVGEGKLGTIFIVASHYNWKLKDMMDLTLNDLELLRILIEEDQKNASKSNL